MIPIPAIDLKDGKVVRLLQGKFKEEKVYADKAADIAKKFEQDGAARIHVVDLDGALGGKPKNIASVESILRAVKTPVEVGGGVRDLEAVSNYLKLGAGWVILGTKACLDKGFMKEALTEFKEKIIVGIDALNGLVATDGWTKVTEIKAVELAKEVQAQGGKTIIYTDISKDGMLKGPNLNEIRTVGQAVVIDVIASGGIGELKDISNIMGLKMKNIAGAIIGKALYENKFTLKEAIDLCSQKG